MKIRSACFVVVAVAGISAGVAWAAKKEIVMQTPEELKWVDVPNAGGAQVANVTGDIFKGAYTALAKIPAGQVTEQAAITMDWTATILAAGRVATRPAYVCTSETSRQPSWLAS